MSERSLVFRVSVAGQAEFARDMGALNALIRKAGAEEIALAKLTADRKRSVRTEEQKHNEAMLRTQIALEKARARESVREAERAEREKAKAAEKATKDRDRAENDLARATIRQRADDLRAFERHEREKTKVAQREARARQREEDDIRKATERAQAATSREIMRQRQAVIRQTQREEFLASRDRMMDAKRLYRGIGGGLVDGAYGAIGAVYSTGARMGRSVLGATGFMDAFDVGDIVSERMFATSKMRSVAIEAREAGGAFGDFDEKKALAKVAKVAKDSGISQRDLLMAIDAASEKGSGADAVRNLERIATQATAMGTDATTIAKMRSQMKVSSKITGREMTDDEIDAFMAKMHFIGKTGVFRAEDVAAQSESLMSQWAKSGGDFNTQAVQYLNFINEARKSTGSGAMARTSINAVQDAILKKESKIAGLGVKVRNADGSERNFIDIVQDTIAKTGGKGEAFNKIFDPARSGKAIATLVTAYQSAELQHKGTGRAAMQKLLTGDESLKNATVAEMNKDAALRMEDAGTRIRKSVETIRQSIGEQLAPILEKLAANAPMIAEKFGTILKWVTDNPGKTAAGVIGAGALKGAAPTLARAALRFAGDSLANVIPGFGGRALGQALGSMGATPVFVTGAAPGVMGGGGGLGGGISGIGGGAMGVAGVMAITAAVGIAVAEAYEKSDGGRWKGATPEDMDRYITAMSETKKKKEAMETDVANLGFGKVIDPTTGEPLSALDMDDAKATASKRFPEMLKKVLSGEMSSVEAGAEIVTQNQEKTGALAMTVGPDGQLQSAKMSDPELMKTIDAFAKIGAAVEAATRRIDKSFTQSPTASSIKAPK